MPEEVDVPPEALVIRFKPLNRETCLKRAKQDHRDTGRYGLSVFADVSRPGETEAELKLRLLAASEVQGMNPATNEKYHLCIRASELLDRKLTFWKDGDEGEVAEHYSVDFGAQEPTLDDMDRFISAFNPDAEKRTS